MNIHTMIKHDWSRGQMVAIYLARDGGVRLCTFSSKVLQLWDSLSLMTSVSFSHKI